ncbi:MAG: lysophospholipid acyltransferase family protein [Bacteroidaceae bacterium]|nr:lysophospholipid acyltransferase family protein [Bacteroidaceae bacterium]
MFTYKLIRGSLWLISLLPFPVLYAISDFISLFVRRFYRAKVVRENLRTAFPEKSAQELKDIERKFYHQLCDNFVEDIKMLSMSKEEIMRRMTFSGLEEIKKRHEAGQTLHFLYLSHFGNWEWISSINYSLRPWSSSGQIYHPLRNDAMDELFIHLRGQYGGVNIKMRETFRRILQLRKEGKNYTIGFISDQQPKWSSIHHFVPFLNHETAVFIGAEHIARKVDAFMMYGRMSRPKRGYYHLEIVPMEDHPASVPETTLTDRYFELLEADIKEHPEMWLWTHKRWSRTKEEWLKRKGMRDYGQDTMDDDDENDD